MTHYSPADVIQFHADLAEGHRHPTLELSHYTAAFTSDVVQKRGANAAAMMFYPMRQVTRDETTTWLRLVGDEIFTSLTFQVNATMCDAVTSLYRKTFPTRKLDHFSYEDLPRVDNETVERGFVWLDEPPAMLDRSGIMVKHRVITWAVIPIEYVDENGHNAGTHRGIRLIVWSDSRVPDGWTTKDAETKARWSDPSFISMVETKIGRLQFLHSFIVPFEERFTYASDASPGLNGVDDNVAWFHAMCVLMNTPASDITRHGLPTPVRHHVHRRVKTLGVRVVTLRKAQSNEPYLRDEETPRQVDWSCRWLVRGFHRHRAKPLDEHHARVTDADREHCADCGVKISWVEPYVKGPEDKPLKVDDGTVYRLSR